MTCPAARSFRPCPARPAPGNGQPVTSAAGRDRLMTDKHTVTVAGVPVTVTVADRVLAITVGRFDPATAGGLLRIHPRSGTSAVGVFIADENGDTDCKPDHRWFFELYPGLPGSAGTLLLCDGCYQGATGLLPQCQDDCPHEEPGHTGLCYRAGLEAWQWCGTQDRLHEVPHLGAGHLPAAGKRTRASGGCTACT